MNKLFSCIPLLLVFTLGLSGCSSVGDKSANFSIIYAGTAVLALLLLIGYWRLIKKKNPWFVVMFCSVLAVNIAYFGLATSASLGQALMANRLAYLGSVFLPLSMLMTILNVTNTKYQRIVPKILLGISILIFLVAASPGILDIYYKEVTFEIINGVSTLNKVYGPLHSIYLFYLLGYFTAMVAVIIRASAKKLMNNPAHAATLAAAVFVNIGIWFIEQLAHFEFEMLSISYIISELFLLSVDLVANENKRLREIVKDAQTVQEFKPAETIATDVILEQPKDDAVSAPERLEIYIDGLKNLTPTEKVIYEAYIARITTKEIMASLNIKENTLKFHNKNIYSKLGVSSRKELLEIYKQLKVINSNEE